MLLARVSGCVLLGLAVLATGPIAAGAGADDQPGAPAQGLDIGQTAQTVRGWVAPPAPQQPWSRAISELTSDDEGLQHRAEAELIRHGAEVLPDLTILADDHDPLLRMRVVTVASGIGGEAPVPLLLRLGRDPDGRVRTASVLGLGRCRGPGVFERLRDALQAVDADERDAGAQSLGALGDVRALALLARMTQESDDLARRDEQAALAQVAAQPAAVPVLAELIGGTDGVMRDTLILASASLNDPRLCPALLAVASGSAPAPTRFLAIRALAHDGDSRAWQNLCRIAAEAGEPQLRSAAADTLTALTGAPGMGQGWTVWWRDHAAEAARLAARDRLLASLHDPNAPIPAAELARWSVDDLSPLLEGALGNGAAWWPARAWAAIRADDPARWSDALTQRLVALPEPTPRLALLILVDQLGGPRCVDNLHRIAADLARRERAEAVLARAKQLVPDRGPERAALAIAGERHHCTP